MTHATRVVTLGRISLAILPTLMYAPCGEAGVVPRIPLTIVELYRNSTSPLISGVSVIGGLASFIASKAPTASAS